MSFSDKDKKQIENKGLTINQVYNQIEIFKTGLPFSNLVSAATIDHGILRLNDHEINHYIELFEQEKDHKSILKFVPASGAATRMFKFLFTFLESYSVETESINAYINHNDNKDLYIFFVGLEKFPFYYEVKDKLNSLYPNYDELSVSQQSQLFVKAMLDPTMLDYGNYPKGLLPFHEYKNRIISTAFEEHLFESALYSSTNAKTKLHFTISEQHKDKFTEEFSRIEKKVETKTNSLFDISFSYQKESTDTIAVTPKDKPFRNDDGSLLFRPSGHGALIENLNDLDADIIFVKNIDNVVVYKYKDDVAKYKKLLAGKLIEIQNQTFKYLEKLDEGNLSFDEIVEIAEFLTNKMSVRISPEFEKYAEKYQIEYLKEKLNRPIRVCGMVKNEGEPGGGPFWVKDESANISLQIVEAAQINKKNKHQKDILNNATHFNPVDLVCGVRNYKGQKFDITKYVDHKAAFITKKTTMGKDLKALELPGLWNGSMANWNTIFVEVPLITFNPVKTVNDLLKAPHQIK
ncbi:DUF4301 domain-containing protein [Hanstruepera neustonica]|uniref:DUF4301 domain-containing protein n=1 Tax=Hanstruepera neustonica TaxID=1445657 RepID=A0A2K1E439_9FLAO|nr:DUF4301 family protein [Hanstruepera neustonica]PNQ75049.1 DUF4301 domain-containing protein [Hanstruepera neustonica]